MTPKVLPQPFSSLLLLAESTCRVYCVLIVRAMLSGDKNVAQEPSSHLDSSGPEGLQTSWKVYGQRGPGRPRSKTLGNLYLPISRTPEVHRGSEYGRREGPFGGIRDRLRRRLPKRPSSTVQVRIFQ